MRNWWGRFLFQGRGIVPSKRLVTILLLLSVSIIILTVVGLDWIWIITFNSLFLLFSLVDLLFSPKKKEMNFTREIPHELERGLQYQVQIKVRNTSDYGCSLTLVDDVPQSFRKTFPIKGKLKKECNFTYDIEAPVRGDYYLRHLYVRYASPLGLWEKQMTIPLEDHVKVIPDLTETRRYLQSAQQFLLYDGEKIRKQKSGVGEFARIRNYVVGDDPRKINWRQTAKLQEVMTNEYEPEHGKYITILIDCGRMMGAELKDGNRLEKSLEAALTVTAAALKNGDYVGVLVFSKDVNVFIPPAKGMDQLQRILQAIYNVKVDATESNYSAVMNYLQTYQKKRSLLLLFSDVHTFLYEESALYYFKRLRQRHLFFMIGIEDDELNTTAKQDTRNVHHTMVKSMAQQQLLFKKREIAKWEKQGLIMVEATEEQLATVAVSYYINLLNEGLL
ncbi:DUF58 domain-containing protein [Ornithinibacillus halophilus]|uniref:DUF58 domain-containing protein n=1 Tax=Ornithinibacillus halophilus TaxID=930117 RepID=UPI002E15D441